MVPRLNATLDLRILFLISPRKDSSRLSIITRLLVYGLQTTNKTSALQRLPFSLIKIPMFEAPLIWNDPLSNKDDEAYICSLDFKVLHTLWSIIAHRLRHEQLIGREKRQWVPRCLQLAYLSSPKLQPCYLNKPMCLLHLDRNWESQKEKFIIPLLKYILYTFNMFLLLAFECLMLSYCSLYAREWGIGMHLRILRYHRYNNCRFRILNHVWMCV